MNSVRSVRGAPSFPGSVFSVTSKGETVVFDPKVTTAEQQAAMQEGSTKRMDGQFSQVGCFRFHFISDFFSFFVFQDIDVRGYELPIVRTLENGFAPGTTLALTIRMNENGQR